MPSDSNTAPYVYSWRCIRCGQAFNEPEQPMYKATWHTGTDGGWKPAGPYCPRCFFEVDFDKPVK